LVVQTTNRVLLAIKDIVFASISVSIIASQDRESLRITEKHRDRAGFDSLAENSNERELVDYVLLFSGCIGRGASERGCSG
jgi:hypothetical protein